MFIKEKHGRESDLAGGDITDLFAAFAGMVMSENRAIGLRSLAAADSWVSKENFFSSNEEATIRNEAGES